MSHYTHYYEEQAGGGRAGVKSVFTGSTYQRGSGIGSFLGGILRQVIPYLSGAAKAVGKEAVRTGLNVLDDVAGNGASFKDSLNTRIRESGKNLKRKAAGKISEMMKGSGYKSLAAKRLRQSGRGRVSARNTLRKKKKSSSGKSKKKRSPGGGRRRKTGKRSSRRRKNKTVRSVADIFGTR